MGLELHHMNLSGYNLAHKPMDKEKEAEISFNHKKE